VNTDCDTNSSTGKKRLAAVSRRSFVKTALTGVGALAASGRAGWAQSGDVIRIGFITPRSGALAGFGEPDGFVLDSARKILADGISAGGKTYKVEILDRDTQSDPTRAGQLAKSLINSDGVDFMLTSATPETVNPVSDACEAAGVPCLSTGMPWEPWYFGRGAKPGEPSPFKWTYHFGFGVANFSKAYISQWNGPVQTNKRVAFLMPNDADGNALRTIFKPIHGKGRLHRDRSGRIRGRHDGLFGADFQIQGREMRNLHDRADTSGLRGVLAPGRAAGIHPHGQDCPDCEDLPIPVASRDAGFAWAKARYRRVLASDVSL